MMAFDFSEALHNAYEHVFSFFIPHKKMFLLYLLTSLGIAWLVWRYDKRRLGEGGKAKDFFAYMFSPGIYNHASSHQDYFIFLINGLIYYGILDQFVVSERHIAAYVEQGLHALFGSPSHPMLAGVPGLTLFTVVLALLFDFSVYAAHVMFHKIPALWAFHKVHHSAEVMTPLTLLRLHPLELVFNSLAYALFVGLGIGVFSYLAMQPMTEARVFGVNVIIFASLVTGVHLRHSHVWLHYPRWLSAIIISPAQHQIHHSNAYRHFDRNLGLTFSFWDKMFGTLYEPQAREALEFGINKKRRNPYSSVKQMYLLPFSEARAALKGKAP